VWPVAWCCCLRAALVILLRRLPRPTLFPYTTLFRSGPLTLRLPRDMVGVDQLLRATGRELEVRGWVVDRGRARQGQKRYMLPQRSEEHTSELQSREKLVCRLLLEKKNKRNSDAGSGA